MKTVEKIETREPLVFESGGSRIFALMHLPQGIQSPPLVIMHHGFASCKIGTRAGHVKIASKLARAGFAALRFDFRGHGDSEGDLDSLGFEDYVQDSLTVLSEMERRGFSQIALYGSSLGGTIATLVAAEKPQIEAIALWAPVASGELWARDFLARGESDFSSHHGAPISDAFRREFLQMRAFEKLSQRTDLALLHGMGGADEILSLSHKKLFEKGYKGSKSRFLYYPDVGHYLATSSCQDLFIEELVDWLERTFDGPRR